MQLQLLLYPLHPHHPIEPSVLDASKALATRSAGIPQSLCDAAERRRQHTLDLLALRALLRQCALLLEQRDLKEREGIDVRIAKADRRLEHGRVAQEMLRVPDRQHRVDRPAELLFQ